MKAASRRDDHSRTGVLRLRSTAIALLASMATMSACANPMGGTTMNTRILPAFSAITLNGVGTVRLKKGPQAVNVTVDAEFADLFETGVKNGRLIMGFKCGLRTMLALSRLETCIIDISIPSLDGVEVNGAGAVSFTGFSGGSMVLTTNGAAHVTGELVYDDVKIRMTGAGEVGLEGEASTLDVGCTGAARLTAGSLETAAARVSMTGAVSMELRVKDELSVNLSGSGNLAYWGSPNVEKSISSAGSVVRLGD